MLFLFTTALLIPQLVVLLMEETGTRFCEPSLFNLLVASICFTLFTIGKHFYRGSLSLFIIGRVYCSLFDHGTDSVANQTSFSHFRLCECHSWNYSNFLCHTRNGIMCKYFHLYDYNNYFLFFVERKRSSSLLSFHGSCNIFLLQYRYPRPLN